MMLPIVFAAIGGKKTLWCNLLCAGLSSRPGIQAHNVTGLIKFYDALIRLIFSSGISGELLSKIMFCALPCEYSKRCGK